VQGIGEDILPGTMDFKMVDEVLRVTDEECFVMARRMARLEGIFAGGSCGGCVAGALHLAKSLQASDFVVAFLPDTGMRYLSNVYNDSWIRDHGYTEQEVPLNAGDILSAKRKAGKVRELIVARPEQTVFHAMKTMQTEDISQIPVCEEDGSIGTISEDQVLNLALQGKDLRKLVIREVMGPPLPRVPQDTSVERLTQILSRESPAVLVEGGGRLDILTKYDIVGTIARLVEQVR
jgi:cystathionine beta-synthase